MSLSFPVLPPEDLHRVAQTILGLFNPGLDPARAQLLQQELQQLQSTPDAWGLISGLANHDDPNVRFFSAHTAQIKISRDWDSLPAELQPALLQLLLSILASATTGSGNTVYVRKLFTSLASLILRLPFHQFPRPIVTVLETIAGAAARNVALPPSAPVSGFNTPIGYHTPIPGPSRALGLEWCGIVAQELARAAISAQKREALRRHLEGDLSVVIATIIQGMESSGVEADAACACAESWVTYGLGGDELTALMPHLYRVLPRAAACSCISEILTESLWKYGKGTKMLTEPLIQWTVQFHFDDEEPIELTKMLCALVEHSSDWIIQHINQAEVQAFLGVILRLTGWEGIGGVDEHVSELTLMVYPLLQESLMDSEAFAQSDFPVAKSFFRELVDVVRRKVTWPKEELDKEDREAFESWRRDAGEVIVCSYYILRDEMLASLAQAIDVSGPWQELEAILHCIRYSSEAVPLGEDKQLPKVFNMLPSFTTEDRLRLTTVYLIQSYEDWFRYHPDQLVPALSYLVPALSSHATRQAADALKAICDICRNQLVQHIGAFAELHGKIGSLGPDEQVKVIEGITSVIQALPPADAIEPVTGILGPLLQSFSTSQDVRALAACFKGLTPSDDPFEEDPPDTSSARADSRMVALLRQIEQAVSSVVGSWDGDPEVADALSEVIKFSTDPAVLIHIPPLPLLTLVANAAERSPSALWLNLAAMLVLRIKNQDDYAATVADAIQRLLGVASGIETQQAMRDHPDVVEGWFKFCADIATRFPGVLLRLPCAEAYMKLGVVGLGTQERFSLKSAVDFLIALLTSTRYPSPLESMAEPLIKQFAPQILYAIILSAGAEGPRSMIPNLAELLTALVTRTSQDVGPWLDQILQPGFPDPRATPEARARLKEVITSSRTTKKMREALHEFALISRGLNNTTYGNARYVS